MTRTGLAPNLRGLPLTPRQLDLLGEFSAHGNYQEVARCRGISPQTVKQTLSDAYGRLGVEGGIEAFRAMGWLTPPTAAGHGLALLWPDLDLVWSAEG